MKVKKVLSEEEANAIIKNGNEVTWTEDGRMAIAVRVPKSAISPITYLTRTDVADYSKTTNNIYKQMDLCSKLYRYEGTIGSAVDILTEFAITKLKPEETGEKKLDAILKYFNENINLDCTNTLPGMYVLMQQLGLEWFVSGNMFPYEYWDTIEVKSIGFIDIPKRIVLLNPQSIEIPTDSLVFGNEEIYLKLTDNLNKVLLSDGRRDKTSMLMKQAIPPSMLRSFRAGKKKYSNIRLNPEFIKHLKRKARDFEAWGIPYLTRTFPAMSTIKRLRRLDEATTEGLINLVTIFKIGTDEHPANAARLRAFASLIQDPNATATLVWAHDIDVIQVGPQGKILSFRDKYKEGYEELLRSLGVPPILLDQTGQNNPWVAILELLEKLKSFRNYVSQWLEGIYQNIAIENGYPDIKPKVRWERIGLTDDTAVKNLILNFYDRGLIPIETALEEAGYDFQTQLTRQKDETKDGIKELFKTPKLPFSGTVGPSAQNGRPPKDNEKQNLKQPQSQTVDLENQKQTVKKPPIKNAKGDLYTQAVDDSFNELYQSYSDSVLKPIKSNQLALEKFVGLTLYHFNLFDKFCNQAIAIALDKDNLDNINHVFEDIQNQILNEVNSYAKTNSITVFKNKNYEHIFKVLFNTKGQIVKKLTDYMTIIGEVR